MKVYRDVEKRKEYKKEWARAKALKNKPLEPVVELRVAKSSPESTFCIQYYNMIKLRQEHKLSDFPYWLMKMRRVNNEFIRSYEKYKGRHTIVDSTAVKLVVPPIVRYFFKCSFCVRFYEGGSDCECWIIRGRCKLLTGEYYIALDLFE